MIKSNISISSNIYIRSDPDIRRDRKYTEKITGNKLLNDIRRRYVVFEAIPFTMVQRILSGNQTCSYAKNGEMSFGPVMVDGVICWESRCEYTSSPGFNGCVPQEIPLETITEDDSEDKESFQEFFKKIGIIIEDDTVLFEKDRNTAKTEESPKEYTAPTDKRLRKSRRKAVSILR